MCAVENFMDVKHTRKLQHALKFILTEEQYCSAITLKLVHELALFSHSCNVQDIHSSRLFFRVTYL
jgi:hypothetical protein